MAPSRRHFLAAGAALGAGAACPSGAWAQPSWPERPVRIIVGFAPGGGADIVARLLATRLEQRLGQAVVVDNRPGAGGTIGAAAVARAEPDGYTLLFGNLTLISPTLVKNGGVIAGKDVVPVSSISVAPQALIVRTDLPARSLPELVGYARANPDKLNFGTPSSVNVLAAQVLRQRTGLSFATVPYKGSGPLMQALVTGEVDFTIDSVPAYLGQIRAGKLRALFVVGERTTILPGNVPSSAEAGLADFQASFMQAMWAPVGTPPAILQRLSSEVRTLLGQAEVREQFQRAGAIPYGSTPEEMMRSYQQEMAFWQEAARLARFEPV